MKTHKYNVKSGPSLLKGLWQCASGWWRLIAGFIALLLLWNVAIVSLSSWYSWVNRDQQLTIGATFIPRYARYFNLDPVQTMRAMTDDLKIKQLRLVSYWDEGEPTPGTYDFSDLDWEFAVANQAGAKVSLSLGLRQPRWPECHMPAWASDEDRAVWYPQLKRYMSAVVNRYKDNPALDSYQLENEFFLRAFGKCTDHDRARLVDEFNLVKSLDANHPVIVSRSNNAIGWPVGQPTPDEYGVSVYKRVWDKTITKRYFEYPFPAQFYGALAAITKITQGKDMIIHELQSEPWIAHDLDLNLSNLDQQNKTMNATLISERIDYGAASGLKRMDLWGVEYWYWRKVKLGDPSVWDAAKSKLEQYQPDNFSNAQFCSGTDLTGIGTDCHY